MTAQRVGAWLAESWAVTALTGAGVSTDSGIPDFRGPDGVWTRDPQAARLSTLQAYVEDPALRRLAWQRRREHPAWSAVPNAGHRALIEIDGTMYEVECLGCGGRTTMREVLDRVAAGEPDPACRDCGGILKSATISFGQAMDGASLRAAIDAAAGCDLLLAIGTSLTVHPAAALVEVAAGSGARVVIVNASPTPYDDLADAVLREPIGEVLPALVQLVGT